MYNRYMSTGFDELFTSVSSESPATVSTEPVAEIKDPEPAVTASSESAAPAKGGGLSSMLERINIPKLDMDTILLLLIVFFLLTDGNESKGWSEILGENTDLLLIVGLLLIMGF